MVTVIITKKLDHIWDLGALCNGILAGLVSITAGCATVLPWHSMFIGSIGGLVYLGGSRLELKFKVYSCLGTLLYVTNLLPYCVRYYLTI
jgi:Amt family ammonium transporter